jgi:hypothetical protein
MNNEAIGFGHYDLLLLKLRQQEQYYSLTVHYNKLLQ